MARDDHLAAPLLAAIAQEIREIRGLIERVADLLVADEAFVLAYITQLQSFDLAIQRSDESAALLDRLARGVKASDAIKTVRLDYVHDKLTAALAGGRRQHGIDAR